MLIKKKTLFKNFIRYTTSYLVFGAIIILGFLAFSGIYALTPILWLAISAFLLAVVVEGEIYYQTISKAIKSLIKPHYIESKLAEECLQEVITDISYDYEIIYAINELTKRMDILTEEDDSLRKKYEEIKKLHERQKQNSKISKIRNLLTINNIPGQEDFESFLKEKEIARKSTTPIILQMSFAKPTFKSDATINIKNKLLNLKDQITNAIPPIPQFFIDYAQLATIDHTFAHINPTVKAKERKKFLNISLSSLEQIFTEQLFSHTELQKKSTRKWWPFKLFENTDSQDLQNNTNDIETGNINNIKEYKRKLHLYLKENLYIEKYNKKLPKRKTGSKFIKVLSSVCGCFMILGTSYLLIEAFAVVPLLAAIPFGILPAIVVPLAIIAGIAYGIQTYRSLDEMLNSDIVSSRLAKIRADLKNGLNFYTGTKLVIFFLLLGLAITLTICTGGTWYTVIKYTKPVFSWLSKIPTAVIGIVAGFLAISSLAFNISNSAQTSEELEEAFESQVPEDHPYNIDLLEIPEGKNINECIKYVDGRTAIIKQGKKYFIHCCPSGETEWRRIELPESSYLLKALLNRINFSNKILYYSVFHTSLYNLIRKNTAHKFNPSKENWIQFANPARIILIFTYVPLRIIFFLGHLASISATSDRLPGIPEIISMIIGFVAELFEDLHYFTSFNHNHKNDLPAIVTEHFKEEDSCDHANDLPTRVLRDYIFWIIFKAAAKWHSYFSNKKIIIDPVNNTKKEVPSISYENAFETLRGKKPKDNPKLSENDEKYILKIEETISSEKQLHQDEIDDEDDLIEISTSRDKLIETFINTKSKASAFSIFTGHKSCACHNPEISRNKILLV